MLLMLILNLVCVVMALFSAEWSTRGKVLALGILILPWTLPFLFAETTAKIGFIVIQLLTSIYFVLEFKLRRY